MACHYLNQCCFFVNWTPRSKLQWNFSQNTKLFIHENASENIVCEITVILSRVGGGGWVKSWRQYSGRCCCFVNKIIMQCHYAVTRFQYLSHKSHNTPVSYPTMHHFVTKMCTCVHISVTKWCVWDICLMHCGVLEMNLLGCHIMVGGYSLQKLDLRGRSQLRTAPAQNYWITRGHVCNKP